MNNPALPMSDKAATATATDLEVDRELDKMNIAPEVLLELFTHNRKPKRKRKRNNNEHDSTVPVVHFTNKRPGKAKFVVALRDLRLPGVMAQVEPNVPLSNDVNWNNVQFLAEITAAYAKSNLVPNESMLSHEKTMEALMRSKYWSVRDPMWRDIVDCTICYFNAVLLPRDHIMLDKYVEIALVQWRKLVEAHGRDRVQHEMDRMLWSV